MYDILEMFNAKNFLFVSNWIKKWDYKRWYAIFLPFLGWIEQKLATFSYTSMFCRLCLVMCSALGCISPKKKPRITKSKTKCLIFAFFDNHRNVHKEFALQSQTVNRFFYREVFEKLRKSVLCVGQNIKNNGVLSQSNFNKQIFGQ